MRRVSWHASLLGGYGAAAVAVAAEVTITGAPVYVTGADCQALVAHHPLPDVAYSPGVDVHGKYVAPADLQGGFSGPPTDHIAFDLKMNPLTYGAGPAPADRYAQTAVPLGRVVVDTRSGAATFNGRALESDDTRTLLAACRKAGFR